MTPAVLTFVNLALCAALAWASMCRLSAIHDRVILRVQVLYVGLFVASCASGLQFYLFGTFAGWADLTIAAAGCLGLWTTVRHWRDGPPATVVRG